MTINKTSDYSSSMKKTFRNLIPAFFIATILTGCSAANDRGMLLSQGVVRIEPATEAGYDYRFSIINGFGMNYDLEKKQDRARAISDFLSEKCKSTQMIRESSITAGTYLSGGRKKLYTIDVKCRQK